MTLVLVARDYYNSWAVGVIDGDRDEADLLAARVNASDPNTKYTVEDLPTIPLDVRRVEVLTMSCVIEDDVDGVAGDVEVYKPIFHVAWPWETNVEATRIRWIRPPMYNDQGGRLEVTGVDHDEVRSVFRSTRIRLHTHPEERMTEFERNPA